MEGQRFLVYFHIDKALPLIGKEAVIYQHKKWWMAKRREIHHPPLCKPKGTIDAIPLRTFG
jgi:hypothetical protein